jgi:hypothetical protein
MGIDAREHFGEPAQLHELTQLGTGRNQHEPVPTMSSGELKPGQRVDRATVGIGEPAHVERNLHASSDRDAHSN